MQKRRLMLETLVILVVTFLLLLYVKGKNEQFLPSVKETITIDMETIQSTNPNKEIKNCMKKETDYTLKNVFNNEEEFDRDEMFYKHDEFEDEEEYVFILPENIELSYYMDLSKRLGISKESFIDLIANFKYDFSGFFEKNAGYIFEICKEYGINEFFFCGLIAAESGWEISENSRNCNNFIGITGNDGLLAFESEEEGLLEAAKYLHENYLIEEGKYFHGFTLEDVKKCFCPDSQTWCKSVYGCMVLFLKKD